MTLTTENCHHIGWANICDKDHHAPYFGTHQLIDKSKYDNVRCEICGGAGLFISQVFRFAFMTFRGYQNNYALQTVFRCSSSKCRSKELCPSNFFIYEPVPNEIIILI